MGELHINLLGTSFSIKATEDSQHLEKLLGYYENIVNDVSKIPAVKNNPLQTSILAGLMLCDELYKTKQTVAELKNSTPALQKANSKKEINNNSENSMNPQVQEITQRMIEKINKVL
ncbi:MAG: cell division protein ZapA [Treponema sp.]|nr:cell division protein ZapA [Spirochaetia bacterium]MDD7768497.1 cell division protein ZapA [Treponema sp.]MDY3131094.1 cell division protein ZapA [Treponema sp.]